MNNAFDVIVVGCGVAGLSAAVSAAEQGGLVAILERAPIEERGGQSRYTEAYLRMKSETEVSDDFEDQLAENGCGSIDPLLIEEMGRPADTRSALINSLSVADPDVIETLADQAGPTVAWLKDMGVRFDFLPTQFLTRSQPRLLPVGGGAALVDALAARAEELGVVFMYDTAAQHLVSDLESGEITGVRAKRRDDPAMVLKGKVILACGGFEGNAEMLTRYIGPRSIYLRPVCRGGYYNRGDGIRMGLEVGAATSGDFGSYHAEPVDPRSGVPEPSVFIYPYGILVNQQGCRFTDEAPGAVDAYYESVTRHIFEQENGLAYAILDARHKDIPNYHISIRTDKPAIEADTIEALAGRLNIPADRLTETISAYNSACQPGEYKPLEPDGLSTDGVTPPKSNWALPLDKAPYSAYPVISANVFTFGGLKADSVGRVIGQSGQAINNLYAVGEMTGLYYGTYTGSTSVLRGMVFGRLAGRHAARH